MPRDPETGKTVRRAMSDAELLEFRLKQTEGSSSKREEVRRGKRRANAPSGTGEQEGAAQSPLADNLGALTLESGGSSANTPGDSPANLPQVTLPERRAPSPPLALETAGPSNPSQGEYTSKLPVAALTQRFTGFAVEVPRASKFLKPALRQASRSQSDTLPVSDDGSIAARIAALERRQDELEKRVHELDSRLKVWDA